MIKPKSLKKGDKIGIIAPASPVYDEEKINKGVEILKRLGFETILGESCFKKYGYLAGDDEIRANDINNFFRDENIDAIICLRGGYGTVRILDKIDYMSIERHPKIFCGYSDITALHCAILKNSNLVTFHGPMIASDISLNDEFTIKSMINCLSGKLTESSCLLNIIKGGDIKGRIIGGNLSMICSLLGTPYQIDFKDKILFLEDIDEQPYRIDRMLSQLRLCSVFKNLKGVILGQFTNCNAIDEEKSFTLNYVISDFFSKLDIPVFSGLPAGHDENKITIPLNIEVYIKDGRLYFLEEGVNNE